MTSLVGLTSALRSARGVLQKYNCYGQVRVVDDIIANVEIAAPDYRLLTSVEMWGGAGAVWDANPCNPDSAEHEMDRKTFWKSIVGVAREMDKIGIGTPRSRQIADIFQRWLNEGIR